jgi:hypothetical protein
MIERRANRRWNTILYLKVLDSKNKNVTGRLVDISTLGLRLISETPFELGATRCFRICLPEKFVARKPLVCRARCKWSQTGLNPDFFESGFQLSGLSAGDEDKIKSLIRDYTFNY